MYTQNYIYQIIKILHLIKKYRRECRQENSEIISFLITHFGIDIFDKNVNISSIPVTHKLMDYIARHVK